MEKEGGRKEMAGSQEGEDLLVRMPGKSLVDLAGDSLGKHLTWLDWVLQHSRPGGEQPDQDRGAAH